MPKADTVSVWAGTRKGAFVFRSSNRKTWRVEDPFFRGWEVKLRVARSRDGGIHWTLLTRGLPQRNAHLLVLRESMAADRRSPAGIYVGTTSGQVFHTADAGNSWKILAENLPPVISVSVAN